MSDSTPEKPKPGSLKDRIAMFNQQAAAANTPPVRPAPAPKPQNWAWKQKQAEAAAAASSSTAPTTSASPVAAHRSPSPTPAPSSTDTASSSEKKGMSANDAREAIHSAGGGSLKERMAALQGKSAFGMPQMGAPPAPKPLKKPVLESSAAEGDDEGEKGASAENVPTSHTDKADPDTEAPAESSGHHSGVDRASQDESREPKADEEEEKDEETKERERRAAIAARMAKLGGARVGMGPPIFGVKPQAPPPKKVTRESSHEAVEEEKDSIAPSTTGTPSNELVRSVPKEESISDAAHEASAQAKSVDTSEEQDSTISTDQAGLPSGSTDMLPIPRSDSLETATQIPLPPSTLATPAHSRSGTLSPEQTRNGRSPDSMPMPAAPKRALPPRKKVVRSDTQASGTSAVSGVSDAPVTTVPAASEDLDTPAHPETEEGSEQTLHDDVPDDSIVEDTSAQSHVDEPISTLVEDDVHPMQSKDPQPEPEDTSNQEPAPQSDDQAEQLEASPKLDKAELPPQTSHSEDREHIVESTEAATEDARDDHLGEETPEQTASTLGQSAERHTSGISQPSESGAGTSEVLSHKGTVDVAHDGEGGSEPHHHSIDHPENEESSLNFGTELDLDGKSLDDMEESIEETPVLDVLDNRYSEEPSISRFGTSPDVVRDPPPAATEVSPPDEVDPIPKELSPVQSLTPLPVEPEKNEDVPAQPSVPQQDDVLPVTTHPAADSSADPAIPDAEADDRERRKRIAERMAKLGGVGFGFAPNVPRSSKRVTSGGSIQDDVGSAASNELPEIGNSAAERTSDALGAGSASPPSPPPPPPLPPARRSSTQVHPEATSEQISDRPAAPHPPPPVRPAAPPPPPPPRRPSIGPEIPPRPRQSLPPPSPPLRPAVPEDEGVVEVPTTPPSKPVRRPLPTPPHPPPPGVIVPHSDDGLNLDDAVPEPIRRPSVVIRSSPPVDDDDDSRAEVEVLEDEDTDPIDPQFYSPLPSPRIRTSMMSEEPLKSPPPAPERKLSVPDSTTTSYRPPEEPIEEDEEQTRRRTIAERMAKLGGLKFGVPGMAPPRRQPSVPHEDTQPSQPAAENTEPQEPENQEESEEAQSARRAAIAARLASQGGLRFGMAPPPPAAPLPAAPVARAPSISHTYPPPPPPQAALPPPPHGQSVEDLELESASEAPSQSDDGVEIEAEDSELEEVVAEDTYEELSPPPIPTRPANRLPRPTSNLPSVPSSAPPPLPPGRPSSRPPIPAGLPPRSSAETPRRSSSQYEGSSALSPTAETSFVMVENPSEAEFSSSTLPRPSRPTRAPPVPQQLQEHERLPSVDRDLPPIPLGQSMISEDDTDYPAQSAEHAPDSISHSPIHSLSAQAAPPVMQEPEPLPSADDLLVMWGSIGTHVSHIATSLADQSKKATIGDGTPAGFVATVLSAVPNARVPSNEAGFSYGHLIFIQTGANVERRATEIMPGDIVALHNAYFKGHKGLRQNYHITAGTEEVPMVGVVGEVEPKKNKLRAFQGSAHSHGHPSVESVSYRLDDLKSGTVKVYRVASA